METFQAKVQGSKFLSKASGIKGRDRTWVFNVLVSAVERRRGPKGDRSLKAHTPMIVGRVVL